MPPSSKGYSAFVLSNAPHIGSVESALRTLTYVLPGRFAHADLVAEAIGATVNIAALYHDKTLDLLARRQLKTTPSNFNKYTAAMLNTSPIYTKIAYALTLMGYLDNLLEQTLTRRFGMHIKWPFVTTYEVIKLALRLALIRMSRLRMLPHQAVEEREFDPTKLQPHDPHALNVSTGSITNNTGFVGSRSGKSFSTMEEVGRDPKTVESFLHSKALSGTVTKPTELLQPLDTFRTLAELAFILRPILYVLMIRKYGMNSWKPWTTSLALEIVSLAVQTEPSKFRWRSDLTELERNEYKKRMVFLVFYILRNPFFGVYTLPRLQKFIGWGSQKILISLVTGVVKDMIPMWENVYYLTAAY
ncbi:hypothetical protein SeMB42_g00823 [Synchytrium endobioticum]|uniref:Peroxisomal membrane protein PEX16 n=1 Tax=Synchytrium endobioticum TaxID=286115 RepID=A0A507DPF1_9FUNG|nr:hypothetical protein SeLEV6574_g03694 [Synchytrium endobioticum]TPX53366.1 hypothetical protein SeMB42_g00823 [Synchytrium endobioticum]